MGNWIQLRRCTLCFYFFYNSILVDRKAFFFFTHRLRKYWSHLIAFFQDLTVEIQELEKQKDELEIALKKVFFFICLWFILATLKKT